MSPDSNFHHFSKSTVVPFVIIAQLSRVLPIAVTFLALILLVQIVFIQTLQTLLPLMNDLIWIETMHA